MYRRWQVINQFKVYQVARYIMRAKPFLYPCLFILVIAQISPQNNHTLLTFAQNPSDINPLLSKAASCILQAHPQLGNFTILDIKNSTTGNDTNKTGVLLALSDGLDKIIVIVSIQTESTPFVVSYTKITLNEDIQVLSPNTLSNVTNNQSQGSNKTQNKTSSNSSQATFPNLRQDLYQTPGGTSNIPRPLGGFFLLLNYSQPRYLKALSHLLSLHPSLSSYSQQIIQYQIVSGVTYLFSYSNSIIKIKIQAKVYTSLAGSISLIDFSVLCLPQAENCNNLNARRLFDGVQHLIKTHKQLMEYKLSSLHVESYNNLQLSFMCSFDNQYLGLRSTADLRVTNQSIAVLSFYSYQYY